MYLQILEKVAMWVLNLVFEPNRCNKNKLMAPKPGFPEIWFCQPVQNP